MSQVLLKAAAAPATGDRFGMGGASLFQATVYGSGAVSVTAVIEVTNDALAWLPLFELSVSGTDVATIANVTDIPWDSCRARITAISGTDATAIVTFNTKSGRI